MPSSSACSVNTWTRRARARALQQALVHLFRADAVEPDQFIERWQRGGQLRARGCVDRQISGTNGGSPRVSEA